MRQALSKKVRGIVALTLGWILVIVGLIVIPLPIPLGLLMVATGFTVLIPVSRTARRGLRAVRRSLPTFSHHLNRAAIHLPVGLRRVIDTTDPFRPRRSPRKQQL